MKKFSVIGVPVKKVGNNFTLIGLSQFTTYNQSIPYLYSKIIDSWQKGLTGYTDQIDNGNIPIGNNGKTIHDRIRWIHRVIDGINNTDTMFWYFGADEYIYQSNRNQINDFERTKSKVIKGHYTALANCFSKSFNFFTDETNVYNISTFADSNNSYPNYWASKSFTVSKNIVILNDHTSFVQFTSTGKTNIVYFISDGIAQIHGMFDIYINGTKEMSIQCNGQTVDLTGMNPLLPGNNGVGDAPASPNSIVFNFPDNEINTYKIQSTSDLPVWLDYYSTLETDPENGAKPIFSMNNLKFYDGEKIPIGNGDFWTANQNLILQGNAGVKEVFDYFHDILGAPVFLADGYSGWDPYGMTQSDLLHPNQLGSTYFSNTLNEAIKFSFDGKKIII